MIPDLGKYALWVLSAYGVSLALLGAIVVLSALQARRTRRALQAVEKAGAARPSPAPAPPARETADG